MRKDLDRRLKRLEAAFSVERFDIIGGIVCVGMGSAEDREPAADKEMSAVDIEEHECAADEDLLAKERGSPEPIAAQQTVTEGEPAADEEWVEDWYVEADGRVSKIKERICSSFRLGPDLPARCYGQDVRGSSRMMKKKLG